MYNAFNVYRRELAPGTVSLTGDRAQGDDSKHWAYSKMCFYKNMVFIQNAFSRDCNGKVIERIEGQYSEVVVFHRRPAKLILTILKNKVCQTEFIKDLMFTVI